MGLLIVPFAVGSRNEDEGDHSFLRQQILFSSIIYATAGIPAVGARYWQRKMLRDRPIDAWGLSSVKLFVQFLLGACLVYPLVQLQWTGRDGNFWVNNTTDVSFSENLRDGFPCIFAAKGGDGKDDEDPATSFDCPSVYGYAFSYVVTDAAKSLASVWALRRFGNIAPVRLTALVGSLLAFIVLLPWWTASSSLGATSWPVAAEAHVPGPLWRHLTFFAAAPVLFFGGMAGMFGLDVASFLRRQKGAFEDMLPLTTEAAFPLS
eukprot:g55.t1